MPEPDAEHRLLKLLAANPAGCNEFLLLALGFSAALIAELIRDGLATATARQHAVEKTYIKITGPGFLVLADW